MNPPSLRIPPLPELRAGYRTDVYFRRAKQALEAADRRPHGLMQVFQKKDALLCGMGEALVILAAGAGHYRDDMQADRLFADWMQARNDASSGDAGSDERPSSGVWIWNWSWTTCGNLPRATCRGRHCLTGTRCLLGRQRSP